MFTTFLADYLTDCFRYEKWTDVYFKGSAPPYLRGREKEEVHYYSNQDQAGADKEKLNLVHGLGQTIAP